MTDAGGPPGARPRPPSGPPAPRTELTPLAVLILAGALAPVLLGWLPIALTTAADLGISPHALTMGVALSAASLSSPVAHPANVLVMGPGGYRYVDYLKLGLPLTVLVILIVVWVLFVFFPFTP